MYLFQKLSLFTYANSPRVPVDEISAQPQTLKTLLSTLPRAVLNKFFFLQYSLLASYNKKNDMQNIASYYFKKQRHKFALYQSYFSWKPRLYLWGTGISLKNFITRNTRLSLGIRKHPDLRTFHLRSADKFTLNSTNTWGKHYKATQDSKR